MLSIVISILSIFVDINKLVFPCKGDFVDAKIEASQNTEVLLSKA